MMRSGNMKEFIYFIFALVVIGMSYMLTLTICSVLPECLMPVMFLFLGYFLNEFEQLMIKIYRNTEEKSGGDIEVKLDATQREIVKKYLVDAKDTIGSKKFNEISTDEMDTINTIQNIIEKL